jgi:quercetin dioxygenase-like cupin family protein
MTAETYDGREGRDDAKERIAGGPNHFHIGEAKGQLLGESEWQNGNSNQITLVKDGPLRVALFAFHPGNRMPDHRVAGPALVQLISGKITLTMESGERFELTEGDLLTLPEYLVHDVEAQEQSLMLLTIAHIHETAKQPPDSDRGASG